MELPSHITSFVKKLVAQQTSILEAIEPTAGVSVTENGRTREGPELSVTSSASLSGKNVGGSMMVDSTCVTKDYYEKLLHSLADGSASLESNNFSLQIDENNNQSNMLGGSVHQQSSIIVQNEASTSNIVNADFSPSNQKQNGKKKASLLSADGGNDSLAHLLSTTEDQNIEDETIFSRKENTENIQQRNKSIVTASRNDVVARQIASPRSKEQWGVPIPPAVIHSQPPRPALPSSGLLGSPESRRARSRVIGGNSGSHMGANTGARTQQSALAAAGAATLKVIGGKAAINKAHLAPPPYGATMGHGLVESEKDKYYYPPTESLVADQREIIPVNGFGNMGAPGSRTRTGSLVNTVGEGISRVTHSETQNLSARR
eukprot:GDKJ01042350.1.p1 GENE.GDKJ01042350.1~~GDKJ01042350.1.p1  ORF type:complete len:422 (+),score=80.94 GDKJ01042350.1:143-1267(+)